MQSTNGPPHYVDLHVKAGECVLLQFADGQEQVVAGPTTITMISQQQNPPVPIPVQAPPGHMIHQIADENGTLKHIILSIMGNEDSSNYSSNYNSNYISNYISNYNSNYNQVPPPLSLGSSPSIKTQQPNNTISMSQSAHRNLDVVDGGYRGRDQSCCSSYSHSLHRGDGGKRQNGDKTNQQQQRYSTVSSGVVPNAKSNNMNASAPMPLTSGSTSPLRGRANQKSHNHHNHHHQPNGMRASYAYQNSTIIHEPNNKDPTTNLATNKTKGGHVHLDERHHSPAKHINNISSSPNQPTITHNKGAWQYNKLTLNSGRDKSSHSELIDDSMSVNVIRRGESLGDEALTPSSSSPTPPASTKRLTVNIEEQIVPHSNVKDDSIRNSRGKQKKCQNQITKLAATTAQNNDNNDITQVKHNKGLQQQHQHSKVEPMTKSADIVEGKVSDNTVSDKTAQVNLDSLDNVHQQQTTSPKQKQNNQKQQRSNKDKQTSNESSSGKNEQLVADYNYDDIVHSDETTTTTPTTKTSAIQTSILDSNNELNNLSSTRKLSINDDKGHIEQQVDKSTARHSKNLMLEKNQSPARNIETTTKRSTSKGSSSMNGSPKASKYNIDATNNVVDSNASETQSTDELNNDEDLLVVSSRCNKNQCTISMRTSLSENNIKSLDMANSTAKSTQTTPQKSVLATASLASDSGQPDIKGSDNNLSDSTHKKKSSEKRKTSTNKGESNLKLNSLPQLRTLNLYCSSVTSDSVHLKWSYVNSSTSSKHKNHHNNGLKGAALDHFVVESSSLKNIETNCLISPKIVYQGCAMAARINNLTAERIYHFRVRRTVLVSGPFKGANKMVDNNSEHVIVSNILSVPLPNVQLAEPLVASTSSSSNKPDQTSSLSHYHNGGASSSANQISHANRCNTSSQNNVGNSHTKTSHQQPIKISNIFRQCRGKVVSMLGKLIQSSLSSYSDRKFAGLLIVLFTVFALLLALFIHVYIVAPVTE